MEASRAEPPGLPCFGYIDSRSANNSSIDQPIHTHSSLLGRSVVSFVKVLYRMVTLLERKTSDHFGGMSFIVKLKGPSVQGDRRSKPTSKRGVPGQVRSQQTAQQGKGHPGRIQRLRSGVVSGIEVGKAQAARMSSNSIRDVIPLHLESRFRCVSLVLARKVPVCVGVRSQRFERRG